jgi:hypothetical protein
MVPLLRAEGGEEGLQVGLVVTEDGRPTVAEAKRSSRSRPLRPSLSTLPEALTVALGHDSASARRPRGGVLRCRTSIGSQGPRHLPSSCSIGARLELSRAVAVAFFSQAP